MALHGLEAGPGCRARLRQSDSPRFPGRRRMGELPWAFPEDMPPAHANFHVAANGSTSNFLQDFPEGWAQGMWRPPVGKAAWVSPLVLAVGLWSRSCQMGDARGVKTGTHVGLRTAVPTKCEFRPKMGCCVPWLLVLKNRTRSCRVSPCAPEIAPASWGLLSQVYLPLEKSNRELPPFLCSALNETHVVRHLEGTLL